MRKHAAAESASSGRFRTERHDHESCVETAIDRAATLCAARGARLTDLRRDVLALVWEGHAPVGAYHILDALKRRHPGAAPPTVYRALEFLSEQGLIHRIESLNAYVGCDRPDQRHVSQFLICERCNATAELDDPAITAMPGSGVNTSAETGTMRLRALPRCSTRETTSCPT